MHKFESMFSTNSLWESKMCITKKVRKYDISNKIDIVGTKTFKIVMDLHDIFQYGATRSHIMFTETESTIPTRTRVEHLTKLVAQNYLQVVAILRNFKTIHTTEI